MFKPQGKYTACGMVHLKKIYVIFIIMKKLLFEFLQTQMFLTGSLLRHHIQPSFLTVLFSDGWDTVTALRIFILRFSDLPQAPLTTLLLFLRAAVQGHRTGDLDSGAPFGPRRLHKPRSANPELQTRSQNRGRAVASSDFALVPSTSEHGRPKPGLRGCHKDVLITRVTEHRCHAITWRDRQLPEFPARLQPSVPSQ